MCDHGFLSGGLSLSLDLEIDQAFGPMLELAGETGVRVLDIRGHVFSVRLDGKEHAWEIDGLEALIDTLNRRLAGRKDVKALVNLGEWEDMLQVWALPREVVAALQKTDWFKPANPAGLKASLAAGRSPSR